MPNVNMSFSVEELEKFKEKKREFQFRRNKDFTWKELIWRGMDSEM